MRKHDGIIGVSDHGGWAVLVTTVADDATLLDRRRVELVDDDLPRIPHHSEAQALPLDEAVALVERVTGLVQHAHERFDERFLMVARCDARIPASDAGAEGVNRRIEPAGSIVKRSPAAPHPECHPAF